MQQKTDNYVQKAVQTRTLKETWLYTLAFFTFWCSCAFPAIVSLAVCKSSFQVTQSCLAMLKVVYVA